MFNFYIQIIRGMDFLYLAYYFSLFCLPIVVYLLCLKQRKVGFYTQPAWYHFLKKPCATSYVAQYQEMFVNDIKNMSDQEQDRPREKLKEYEVDNHIIYAADNKGNYFRLKITLRASLHAEISIEFRNKDGQIYRLPNEPEILVCSIASRQWKAAGLTVEILKPFQTIRITYNGFMRNCNRNTTAEEIGDVEHVKFNFLWTTATVPLRYPQDTSVDMLSSAVSIESWNRGEWINMLGAEYGYDQFGDLKGNFYSKSLEDNFVHMSSWRKRRIGPADAIELIRDVSVFGVQKDGTVFAVGAKSLRMGCTQLPYGCVLTSAGSFYSISSNDIALEHLADNREMPNVLSIHFQANGKTYKCVAHVSTHKITLSQNNEKRGWLSKTATAECDVNSDQANAILTFWYKNAGNVFDLPTSLLKPKKVEDSDNLYIVPLHSSQCLDLNLTGGKGNSLGMLAYSLKSNKFEVPLGFVITTNSFKRHLEANPQLSDAINNLEDICYSRKDGNIEETCILTTDLFERTPVINSVATSILSTIQDIKGTSSETNWRWAVRSSGVDEDSDDLSAAGQNSTILGCKTQEDILRAVSKCWASLFTFQSVQYRRQRGIPVNAQMAVVIQKMIPADCAGVLFTCHPSTGDPSQIVITSNYGLGESVVSASADPDTIILSRSYKDEIGMLKSEIGGKKIKITLNETENAKDGTEEIETEDTLAKKLSITEEQAIRLGKIGVILEKKFGNPRDIEWAFYNDVLYLLQSRPITTLNTWTNWELQHEMDTAILSDESIYTRANVGEVAKGAMTVLTQSIVTKTLDRAMREEGYRRSANPYALGPIIVSSHTMFLDMLNYMYNQMSADTLQVKMIDLAVFGHLVFTKQLGRIVKKRHGELSMWQKIRYNADLFPKLWNTNAILDKILRYNNTWEIKFKSGDSALRMLERIEVCVENLNWLTRHHTHMSTASVAYQMIAMLVMTEGNKDFTDEHYKDLSLLLATNASIESAEIPVILDEIATNIRNTKRVQEFLQVDPNDAMAWLEENCPRIKTSIDEFLSNNGHRLFREFELKEKSWGMNPAVLLSMIQANCVSDTTTKKGKGLTINETVANLTTPKKKSTKYILKYFIKKCRTAVANREKSKSEVVRGVHKFRLAYREVAKKMTKEGYLPEEDLIFHFTQEELKSVASGKPLGYVSKALRRKRLYDEWDKLHFPELNYGAPEAERNNDVDASRVKENGFQLRGTPVCQGVVVARACVITDIRDAKYIQSGDVLITYSTDIAWSPYFPMLSGVVTELGGLISHGAVVAREYGLPCIVSAQNATKYFKTGDTVKLSGHLGLLELME